VQTEGPWAVLGVEPGATREVITRAFRLRALETHPDRGGDPEAYIAVRAAYERLRHRQR
jgi:curved DNA-binding protein CbpA